MNDEHRVIAPFGRVKHADATSDACVAGFPEAPQTRENERVAG